MKLKVYLNELGDAQEPLGIPVATTEREFLEAVSARKPFVVRGKPLGRWAREYYTHRQRNLSSRVRRSAFGN